MHLVFRAQRPTGIGHTQKYSSTPQWRIPREERAEATVGLSVPDWYGTTPA
jgi:hypothetical protein